MKIAISAGHHRFAKGACFNSFNEYDEALEWARTTIKHLGHKALLVPPGYLKDKVNYINADSSITLAVEIHFNSDKNHAGKGCETLYYPKSEKGRAIAQELQNTLAQFFKPDRGIKEGYYQLDPKRGIDFFIAKTKCTALIIEPEFIHNEIIIKSNREGACFSLAQKLEEVLCNP